MLDRWQFSSDILNLALLLLHSYHGAAKSDNLSTVTDCKAQQSSINIKGILHISKNRYRNLYWIMHRLNQHILVEPYKEVLINSTYFSDTILKVYVGSWRKSVPTVLASKLRWMTKIVSWINPIFKENAVLILLWNRLIKTKSRARWPKQQQPTPNSFILIHDEEAFYW